MVLTAPDSLIGVNGEEAATILPPQRLAVLNCISVQDLI